MRCVFCVTSYALKITLALLWLLIIVVWVRSYWFDSGWIFTARILPDQPLRTDWAMLRAGRILWNREYLVVSHTYKKDPGMIGCWYRFKNERIPANEHADWHYRINKLTTPWPGFDALGVTYYRVLPDSQMGLSDGSFYVAIPCLYLLILLAVPTTLTARRIIRRGIIRRRRLNGCCEYCGYDLRASPDRCPECGCPRIKTA